jgi:hypothetical protein
MVSLGELLLSSLLVTCAELWYFPNPSKEIRTRAVTCWMASSLPAMLKSNGPSNKVANYLKPEAVVQEALWLR